METLSKGTNSCNGDPKQDDKGTNSCNGDPKQDDKDDNFYNGVPFSKLSKTAGANPRRETPGRNF
jgi:hypothetical protein